MTWEELRNSVYEIDGSWRDIYVLNTTKEDWLKWADYVNNNYPVIWIDAELEESLTFDKIDLQTVVRHFDGRQFNSSAKVLVNGIGVNAHFFTEEEIENDIDPSFIRSITDHDNLMNYMKAVSILLNKEVILTGENCSDYAMLKVNGSHIKFLD